MRKRTKSVLCDNPVLAHSTPAFLGCRGQSRCHKKTMYKCSKVHFVHSLLEKKKKGV